MSKHNTHSRRAAAVVTKNKPQTKALRKATREAIEGLRRFITEHK